MNLDRLFEILKETTIQLRKGEVIEQSGNITNVYAMPHESQAQDNLEKVDLHFIVIGVDKQKAEQRKDELIGILAAYPQLDRLAAGPSYIEVGGHLGDQGAALQLFALGHVLGLWKVVTPKTFGITGPSAERLAGGGLVMITGFHSPEAV